METFVQVKEVRSFFHFPCGAKESFGWRESAITGVENGRYHSSTDTLRERRGLSLETCSRGPGAGPVRNRISNQCKCSGGYGNRR